MRRTLVAATLLAALLTPGCGRRTVVTTYPYTFPGETELRARQSWVGHTEEELRDKLGTPTRTETDGKGGRELVYERDRAVEVRTGSDHPIAPPAPGARAAEVEPFSPSRRDVVKKEIARFWVGPDGVIYRADVSAEAWRKGLVPPPPSKDDAP